MINASDNEALHANVANLKIVANDAFARVTAYGDFVATLMPGSPAHRAASQALFLMQDSVFVLQQMLVAILSSS